MPFKNLVDDTSTTVSASTPGAELDLRQHTTLSRASLGVPVRLWVFAESTVANDTGAVIIVDDAGATKLAVPITGTTAKWYAVDGWLPATDAKYDAHYGGNTLGTLKVYQFTLEPFGLLGANEGVLGASIGLITSTAPGVVDYRLAGWTLTKTGGAADTWDSGASSVETIAADGKVECVASESGFRCIGLSATDTDADFDTILHGLSFEGSGVTDVYVVESGVNPYTLVAGKAIGDVLSVERVGTTVYYKINGSTFYTSGVASSGAVRVDTSFYTAAASMPGIRLYDDGVPVVLSWQNITDVSTELVTEGTLSQSIGSITIAATGTVA